MQRKTVKNIVTFLLVLVLTVVTVSTLSMATSAKTEFIAEEYSQQAGNTAAIEATELSAPVSDRAEVSPLKSAGAFLTLTAIPAVGLLMFFKARKKGRAARKTVGRRYVPRSDMAFCGRASARSRV